MKLDILDYGSNCEGIAKIDGKVYFIDGGLKGESVEATITKEKKDFCFGKVNKVYTPSPDRAKPVCKYYGICGGCNLMHIDNLSCKKIKTQVTQNTINKISKLNLKLNDLVQAKALNYRNKMVFAINESGDLCMHDKNNNLVKIDYCYLAQDEINNVLSVITNYIKTNNLKGYLEGRGTGLLRYVVIRVLNGEYLITLVAIKNNLPNINALVTELKNRGLTFGLFVNENKVKGSLIMTSNFTKVYGIDYIQDNYKTLSGESIKYNISPESFLQINNDIKALIYKEVESYLKGESVIIDAYSGAGLMTAIMAKNADYAVGIEIVSSASKDANRLMQDNNITNMININADCSVGFEKIPTSLINKGLSVILDPPRKGADQMVLDKVLEYRPNKIVYISCSPATLARDLVTLASNYDIEDITPYDMFAMTNEVEVVCKLRRKKNI